MKKFFTLLSVAAMAVSANAAVWSVPAEAPEAGATIINDDLMSANTVYATTVGKNVAEGTDTPVPVKWGDNTFEYRMNVRVADNPTAATPTGTDNGGSTPIVITAKQNVKVTLVYRRQKKDDAFAAGDGKDVKVWNQDGLKNVAGTLELIEELGDYGNVASTFALAANNTYTVFGKGTTIGLFGISYDVDTEAVDPTPGDDPAPGDDPTPTQTLISTTCPSNAIAYWYNAAKAEDYVAPVGTFAGSDNDNTNVNYANGDYKTIRVNGKKADLPTNGVRVTPSQPLAEGDVIAVLCYRNKDTDAGASLYMAFSNSTNVTLGANGDGTEINNIALGQAPNELNYTVTAAEAGSTYIDLSRDKASTNIFVLAFQITAGAPVDGINSVVNDALAGKIFNVQGMQVDENYKGFVIKDGKKFFQR